MILFVGRRKQMARNLLGRSKPQPQPTTEAVTEVDVKTLPHIIKQGPKPSPHPVTISIQPLEAAATPTPTPTPTAPCPDPQLGSMFLQKFPIEIRKMIYSYLWIQPEDDQFLVPNGRHLYYDQGHWTSTRCVMRPDDEDPEHIQGVMDRIHAGGPGDLHMWMKRNTGGVWGRGHWRCEERTRGPREARVDRAGFASAAMVCRRMYHEVLESAFELHRWFLCDAGSAHRFLAQRPPDCSRSIRHLDLNLTLSNAEYTSLLKGRRGRITQVWEALSNLYTIHSLRIALDARGDGPWRMLPEEEVVGPLRSLRVLGDFTLELPALLPMADHVFGHLPPLDEDPADPFRVVRRSPLRYWAWDMSEPVQRFRWETYYDAEKGLDDSCIVVHGQEKGMRMNWAEVPAETWAAASPKRRCSQSHAAPV